MTRPDDDPPETRMAASGHVEGNLIQARSIDNLIINRPADPVRDGTPPLVITPTFRKDPAAEPQWIVRVDERDLASTPLPHTHGWEAFLSQHSVGEQATEVLMRIEGTSAQAVILEKLRVIIVALSPCAGLALHPEPHTGAFMVERHFAADLRGLNAPGTIEAEPIDGTPVFPYSVHRSDPESFVLAMLFGPMDTSFVVELDWLCAGRSGTVIIDDHGEPFQGRSVSGRQCYEASRTAWHRSTWQ